MGKKELGTNRQYTSEFKAEAVRFGESIGGNAVAKRLGIPQATTTNWVSRSRAGTLAASVMTPPKRPPSELATENARLRRELTHAKLDLEIEKKAAAYFVRESR